MLENAIAGFSLALSLIMVVGPQNAFVLRQGLRREHVLVVALTCVLSDVVLIAIGVAGFSVIVNSLTWIKEFLVVAGAVFLCAYGVISARRAIVDGQRLEPAGVGTGSLRRAFLTSLALAWLNPLVYLDTVLLLGSVSTGYGNPAAFAAGACAASFAFFFCLGFGSHRLAPYFARPAAWRIFDALVAVIMFAVAARLVFGLA